MGASPVALASASVAAAAAEPAAVEGRLYRAVQRIDSLIQRKGRDHFRTRGEIALRAGFGLGFIDADTPDDPAMLAALEAAAQAVLGEPIS